MSSHPQFSLTLLGGFSLMREGQPCHLVYEKGRALLAFLATEPNRSCARSRLAQLFWPHLNRDTALTNLRQVLLDLRRVLDTGDAATSPLQVDRHAVRLVSGPSLRVDVADALALPGACGVAPFSAQCDPCLHQMEQASARYRGEFLAGFSLPDCPEFDEWLGTQREALHLSALNRLIRLSDCLERMGEFGRAAPFALRGLDMEPWNEQVLIRAMRLLIRTGQDTAALAAYDRCTRSLQRELGVSPNRETAALAEQIRQGNLAQVLSAPTLPGEPTPADTTWTRRQLTAVCVELLPNGACDIDQRQFLLTQPRHRCTEIIQSCAGFVTPIHGSTLLGYFGYPQAHEHAAKQAVHAALALVNSRFLDVDVRVGVHTADVISGGMPSTPDLTGELTEQAMGIRQIAEAGEVLVSNATHSLVAGLFDDSTSTMVTLPGTDRAICVHRVTTELVQSTPWGRPNVTLSPLTGRADEVAILLASWQAVRRGRHQAILIRGEPGIGKSRMLMPLREALDPHASVLIDLRCSEELRHSPFAPLVSWLQERLAFQRDDTSAMRFQKLVRMARTQFAEHSHEAITLLAHLLGLPLQSPYLPLSGTQSQQRDQLKQLLLARLQQMAERHPVLLIVEDLHWADPSTLDLIGQLLSDEAGPRVLAVFTARPEFVPSWRNDSTRLMQLAALDEAQTLALAHHVAPDLAPQALQRVANQSDGVPLFIEELAQQLVRGDDNDIPPTLENLLMSRLDRLGRARGLAQLAATIGREFDTTLLARIARLDETQLRVDIHHLLSAGVLTSLSDGHYRFRHALLRDAAYRSQPRKEREAAHRAVAQQLQACPGPDIRPELLAQHWAASGSLRQAVLCWLKAGQLASEQSACQEALQHFRAGLALVASLPDEADRTQMELDLLLGLGAAACAAQGYASLEGSEAYARAVALSEQHQDDADMFPGFWGLWASASSRVGHGHALTVARRLIRMAEQTGNPIYLQQAHFAAGNSSFWRGDFSAARSHLELASSLYRTDQHAKLLNIFGEDAGVTTQSYLSWVLRAQGHPDLARQRSTAALTLARQLNHPFSLGYALTFAAVLACHQRDVDQAEVLGNEALQIGTRYGFPLWVTGAQAALGWVAALRGDREGVDTIRRAREAASQTMSGVSVVLLTLLADAQLALGCPQDALTSIQEALSLGRVIGDFHDEPNLLRMKGLALQKQRPADPRGAQDCFTQALALARHQQARQLACELERVLEIGQQSTHTP